MEYLIPIRIKNNSDTFSKVDEVLAYDTKALELYGPNAKLNIIQ